MDAYYHFRNSDKYFVTRHGIAAHTPSFLPLAFPVADSASRPMPTPFAQEESNGRYKTIALELIQEQYPALHEQLCQERTLLATVND